jgi:hypothetical protein
VHTQTRSTSAYFTDTFDHEAAALTVAGRHNDTSIELRDSPANARSSTATTADASIRRWA